MSRLTDHVTELSEDTLLNIMTSLCDSGVPEYLRDVKRCKQELEQRGYRVGYVKEPSKYIPSKVGRRAVIKN